MNYNPKDWYFAIVGDAERVFSSARLAEVPATDADYLAWCEDGGQPTVLPDMAAIRQVLTDAGLPADLAGYAANARYAKETGGIMFAGVAVATDDRSKQMIMGARIAAAENADFSTPWVSPDGSIATLSAPEVIAISNAVLAHVAACFASFASVIAGIAAGDIASTEDVDAAFA